MGVVANEKRCWPCSDEEHISQEARWVDKHEHQGYPPWVYPCDKAWTVACQTDHGSLCFIGDYESQSEATRALDEHIRAGRHIWSCAGDTEPVQKCRVLAGKEKNDV